MRCVSYPKSNILTRYGKYIEIIEGNLDYYKDDALRKKNVI